MLDDISDEEEILIESNSDIFFYYYEEDNIFYVVEEYEINISYDRFEGNYLLIKNMFFSLLLYIF